MTLSRDLLTRAFPDNPMLVGELEELGRYLDDARAQVTTLLASAADAQSRLASIESEGNQPYSELLVAIAEAPDDKVGVFEKVGVDQIIVRGVDTTDDSCLVPRMNLMSYVGKGATGSRPALSAQQRAVYFDTTLAADGKPVFWTGTAWVDADGAIA